MFWKKFRDLCEENKKSANAVAEELKLSSGSVTAWKNGAKPRAKTVEKIAKYFNVPVAIFENDGQDETTKVAFNNAEKLNDKQRALVQNLINQLTEEENGETAD